jgi:Fe-Mn family superoxide dismutase
MYILPKLEYPYNGLEPHIDKQTMMVHHKKHHQGYINKLNKELTSSKSIMTSSIEELQHRIPSKHTILRNNGGGHYNHHFFWKCMTNNKKKRNIDNYPEIKNAICNSEYGSIHGFYKAFESLALSVFGSGWCWLIKTPSGKLKIITTRNQDNPLMTKVKEIKHGTPLLGLDVWEHAYYLKYQNKRNSYIRAFFNVINWEFVYDTYFKL